MDMSELPAVPRAGAWMRLHFKISGVDEPTMQLCPPQDWDNVRAIGEIMLFVWIYQTALFAAIGHRLFAAPGQIRPEIILAAMFLASFILVIDSYVVMRSGWHLSGINELKRGGIDVGGGVAARTKAGLFLTIRLLLSACLAQLTAIFLALLIFNADVTATLDAGNRSANAALIATATTQVDAEIQRATAAIEAEAGRDATLAGQVTALREQGVDPAAGDTAVQQARRELTDALTVKAKADDALQAAQSFASGELGGVAGPGHSGVAGNGIRHKAALESVANAKGHAEAAAREVAAARTRLDALRRGAVASDKDRQQHAQDQLPAYESTLTTQEATLAAARQHLADLIAGRDAAIRAAVDGAPDYVAPAHGLLAEITALDTLAHANRKIAAVIILIDVISFAFELAAVLAKVISFVPTTYAALLARDAYLQAVRIANGMLAELDAGADEGMIIAPEQDRADGPVPPFVPAFTGFTDDPFTGAPVPPAKRPRGRPRKTPLN